MARIERAERSEFKNAYLVEPTELAGLETTEEPPLGLVIVAYEPKRESVPKATLRTQKAEHERRNR